MILRAFTLPPNTDFRNLSPGYCEARWDEAVLVCKNSLAEKDYRKVLECSTCEQLLVSIHQKANEYTNQRISPLLKRVEPFLSIIRQLTLACALTVRNHFVASGIIWGLVSLLIEVVCVSLLDSSSANLHRLQLGPKKSCQEPWI